MSISRSATRAKGSQRNEERFSGVEGPSLPRSAFNRSLSHKTTFDSGLLIPVFHDEILPGDTVNLTPTFFARLATPFKPFMDGLHLDWQFFFTPTRLVWDNFVKMMGERTLIADHNDYTLPQMTVSSGHAVGSLADYFGLPILQADIEHHSLMHRVYMTIWNEWYRDESLQDTIPVDTGDGPDIVGDFQVMRRGKRKDYFTGALPFAQKGDPTLLPLGTTAPLIGTIAIAGSGAPTFDVQGEKGLTGTSGQTAASWESNVTGTPDSPVNWFDPQLGTDLSAAFADLSAATSATINDIRQAIGIQHLLERDARGGSRYREITLAHFGVHTDDIRLMRPELLATGTTIININPVAQTARSGTAGEELGDLSAFVMAQATGRGFNKTFTEHGYLMGIISVRADLSYQQGIERAFLRETRVDHYWPDLSHLGEQVIESREIFADGTGDKTLMTGDFSVWGYQPRYEEYRHRQSMITGQFRSQATLPLDIWHLAIDFQTRPVLNAAFIEENPPVKRVIVVQTEPEFLLDCSFKIRHVRAMPKYATPGMTRF